MRSYSIERQINIRHDKFYSNNENIALGSVIKVKVGKKVIPMKTTTHRHGDMIEATANGKKYHCSWWMGEWTSSVKK